MPARCIAFFGATGDCAGHTLALALDAGYTCVALVRTPAKLTKSMKDKGVSTSALDQHLTIVEGNVKDVEAVKKVLQGGHDGGEVVDTIVSGIGGTPTLQWSLWEPVTLTDPTICRDAGNTILEALSQLKSQNRPLLVNISTTGIQPEGKPRDVPLLFVPLYHWFLAVPHTDKAILERSLAAHVQLPESQRGIGAYVNVKPSLLMDGEGYGVEHVREGIEDTPAVGYTIQRKDVAAWIFERLLKNDVRQEWKNKGVAVTY